MKANLVCLVVLTFLIVTGQSLSIDSLTAAEGLFASGQYKECVSHLRTLTKKEPTNLRAWILMGDCYSKLEKNRKAIKAYEEAVKIDPSHEQALFALGVNYAKLEKRSGAMAAFKRVVEINPSHAEAHFSLGVLYEAQGSMSHAWEEYKVLKTLDEELADKLYHIIFW